MSRPVVKLSLDHYRVNACNSANENVVVPSWSVGVTYTKAVNMNTYSTEWTSFTTNTW